jgi:hypothetical protein
MLRLPRSTTRFCLLQTALIGGCGVSNHRYSALEGSRLGGGVGRRKKATKNTGEISRSHSSEHEDAGLCSLGQLNSAANSGAKHCNTT